MSMNIALILGTARKGNKSSIAATMLQKYAEQEHKVDYIDVREYVSEEGVGIWQQEKRDQWRKQVEKTDAFIIVVPEYNHAYPGELKIVLDSLKDEYKYKPVAIATVSSGGFGGVRTRENLLPVLVALGMVPIQKGVAFSRIQNLENKDSQEQNEKIEHQAHEMLTELAWYAKQLQSNE